VDFGGFLRVFDCFWLFLVGFRYVLVGF